jgi:dienelactone hydrolase
MDISGAAPTEQPQEQPQPVPPKPALWKRAWLRAVKLWQWFRGSFLPACVPSPAGWRGAAWALIVVALLLFSILAWSAMGVPERNWAGLIPIAVLLAAAALVGALFILVAWLLAGLLRAFPRFYRWALGGALVLLSVPLGFLPNAPLWVLGLVLAVSLAGGGLGALLRGGWRHTSRAGKVAMAGALLLGWGTIAAAAVWLLWQGSELKQVPNAASLGAAQARVPKIALPDPSKPGAYTVRTLTYGSGKDRHRPEFAKNATLTTASVDGSKLVEGWKGAVGWARTRYWGFDTKQFPLQARVWYPDGPGPFPLVLIVHGNHLGEEFSDPGYDYLGELLASRGFILASVDENFLNGSPVDALGFPKFGLKEENDARGWLLLQHLRQWKKWNETPGNPFHQKVDMNNIGLMGHSRGGEAVAVAAVFNRLPFYPDNARVRFDFNFNVRAVVAIAPVDGQYKPANTSTKPENVNYLVLQGSHDADMRSFHGARVYERVKFTDGNYWFKSGLWIYGANHGQFNRVWGRTDAPRPASAFLNLRQLIPDTEQQQIAKIYISAFLEAALHRKKGYIPLFRDHRAAPAGWLPGRIYLHQFADSASQVACNYEEDINLASTTIPGGSVETANLTDWKERELSLMWGTLDTRGVYIGWNKKGAEGPASYTIHLPEKGLNLEAGSALFFSMADSNDKPTERDKGEKDQTKSAKKDGKDRKKDEKPNEPRDPIDLTIEVADAAGASARLALSSFSFLQPRIESQVSKTNLAPKNSEIVFQIFEFPLEKFVAANPKLKPAKIRTVRFLFDRTESGVVILDDVAFRPQSADAQKAPEPSRDRKGASPTHRGYADARPEGVKEPVAAVFTPPSASASR